MELNERTRQMIERYGEAVSQVTAGKIIDRSPSTIRIMLRDGRLEPACAGTRVDVYSIARYICAPAQIDSDTRQRKRGNLCNFRV